MYVLVTYLCVTKAKDMTTQEVKNAAYTAADVYYERRDINLLKLLGAKLTRRQVYEAAEGFAEFAARHFNRYAQPREILNLLEILTSNAQTF